MNATTATTAKGQTPPAHVGMFQLLNGVFVVGAVSCLARLGIPDLVEHGPRSADELAAQIGVDPPALYRLMRATACVGVLSEGPGGKFSETPLSAVLRSNANPSLRAFAMMHSRDWHGLGWSQLDYCVRTGKQALEKIYGMPIFQFFEQHPEEGHLFQQSMTDLSTIDGPAVADAYSFGEIHSIVDVGGRVHQHPQSLPKGGQLRREAARSGQRDSARQRFRSGEIPRSSNAYFPWRMRAHRKTVPRAVRSRGLAVEPRYHNRCS